MSTYAEAIAFMNTEPIVQAIANELGYASVTEQQQKEQPQKPSSSKYNSPDGPQSSKRLISKACREVLLDPHASPKQKLQAASVLERIIRWKYLASARKRKDKKVKNSPSGKSDRLNELLEHAS